MEKLIIILCLVAFIAGYLWVSSRRTSMNSALATLGAGVALIAISFYLVVQAIKFPARDHSLVIAGGFTTIVVLFLLIGLNTVMLLRSPRKTNKPSGDL